LKHGISPFTILQNMQSSILFLLFNNEIYLRFGSYRVLGFQVKRPVLVEYFFINQICLSAA
jgi:hypothetical protein